MAQTTISSDGVQENLFPDFEKRLSVFASVWIVGFFLPAALLPLHFKERTEQDGYPFLLIPHLAWCLLFLGCLWLFVKHHHGKLGFMDGTVLLFCIYLFFLCATPSLFIAAWSLFFLSQCLRGQERQLALTTLKALLALHVVIAYLAYLFRYQQFHSPHVGYRASGLYFTPFFLAPHLLIFFFLLFAELLCHQTTWRTPWRWNAPFFVLVLIILTYTRGCWLGLAAGLVVISFHQKRARRFLLFLAAIALIIGAFWLRAGKDISRQQLLQDSSAMSRLSDWQLDVAVLPYQHLWLGAYALLHPAELTSKSPLRPLLSNALSHWLNGLPYQSSTYNLFLDFLGYYGILGTMPFLLFTLALFRFLCKQNTLPDLPSEQRSLTTATLGAWTALLVGGLFDPNVFTSTALHAGLISLLLLTGLTLSWRFDKAQTQEPTAM
jgi:hypothetical protein